MYSDEGLVAAMTMLGIIMLIGLLAALVLYILRSIGLMTIARNRGLSNSWLAWIPVAWIYTLGDIADDIAEKETGKKSIFRFLLIGGNILSVLISFGSVTGQLIPMFDAIADPYGYGGEERIVGSMLAGMGLGSLTWILSIAMLVITVIALHRIYKCYRPDSAVAYTVLSVLFGFLQSVFPFVLRNEEPKMQQPAYTQQGNYPPQGGYTPQGNGGYPPQGSYAQPDTNQTPPPSAAPDMFDESGPPQDM